MIGPMELLIMAAICLIPIVLVMLAALVVLAVMVLKKNERRPQAGEDRVETQGEKNGEAG